MASSWVPRKIQKQPLLEHNETRTLRPIVWKARRLNTYWAPVATMFSGAPAAANMHWAIQLGRYMHQIHTDEGKKKYLQLERLKDAQVWQSEVPEKIIGWTSMTDWEADMIAKSILERMQTTPELGGQYDPVFNNCQTFVITMALALLQAEVGSPSSKARNTDIVLREIADLTRCHYQHQRNMSASPYWKEAADYMKAYPQQAWRGLKWAFMHPYQYVRTATSPRRMKAFYESFWSGLVDKGKIDRIIRQAPRDELRRLITGGNAKPFG